MKRIELQPAKLSITIEREPGETPERDGVRFTVFRDDERVLRTFAYRGELCECGEDEFITAGERNQISAALVAEWLDWLGDSVPSETILDVFARLKQSLIDGGVIKGEGSGAE